MAVFKANLSTYTGTSATSTASSYYASGGHPFVGYTMLTNKKVGNYGIFDSTAVKEYLQRNDTGSAINGQYAIDLSTIYETGIPNNSPTSTTITVDSSTRNKSTYLPCAELGKGLNGKSLNYYVAINDDDILRNTSGGGYPIEDGNVSYDLPYNDSVACDSKLYINFMAFGYCMSNTPYVGIGLYRLGTSKPTVTASSAVTTMESTLGEKICVSGTAYDATTKNYIFRAEGYGMFNTTFLDPIFKNNDYTDCSVLTSDLLNDTSLYVVFKEVAKKYYNGGNERIGNLSYNMSTGSAEYTKAQTLISTTFNKGIYIVTNSKIYKYTATTVTNKVVCDKELVYNFSDNPYMASGWKYSSEYNSCSVNVFNVSFSGTTSAQCDVGFLIKGDSKKLYYYNYEYRNDNSGDMGFNPLPGTGSGNNGYDYYQYSTDAYNYRYIVVRLKITTDSALFEKIKSEYIDPDYVGEPREYNYKARSSYVKKITSLTSGYYVAAARLTSTVATPATYEFAVGRIGGELIKCRTALEGGCFNRFDYLALAGSGHNSAIRNYLPDAAGSASGYNVHISDASWGGTNPLYHSSSKTLDSSMMSMKNTVPNTNVLSTTYNKGAGIPYLGYVSGCDVSVGGKLYVKQLTLIFKGNTTKLTNTINIYKPGTTQKVATRKMNSSPSYSSSDNTTRYTISFTESDSPSYVSNKTNSAMIARQCGMQQLVRLYSYDINHKYVEGLTSDSSSRNNQWNAVKIAGCLEISITGSMSYTNGNNDIILVGTEVKIADNTSIDIYPWMTSVVTDNYAVEHGNPYDSLTYPFDSLYGVFLKEQKLSYYGINMKSMFISSMSGAPTRNFASLKASDVTTDRTKYYCDSSILSKGFGDSSVRGYLSSIELSSTTPMITCASYANTYTTGSLYTYKTFDSANSLKPTSSLSFNSISNDIVDTGKAGKYQCTSYVKIEGNTTTGTKLSTEFKNKENIVRYKLPEPGLSLSLIYESVEFNGISAWTFTRSVPLNAASKARPHMLVYKVEAWLEKEVEGGGYELDEENTKSLVFCVNTPGDGIKLETTNEEITEEDGTIVYSGYGAEDINKANKFTGFGINHINFGRDGIINNMYLKYNDGHSTVQNAIGTSFPITILTGGGAASFTDSSISYYGGGSLPYEVIELDYTQYNTDASIYAAMYGTMSSTIASGTAPVCVCGCSCKKEDLASPSTVPATSLTNTGHKIIYLGIGFYNPCNEIIPINALFSIKYPFTTQDGKPGLYFVRIPLSQFFPTNSMMYMSGADRGIVNTDEAQKIRFISDTNYTSFKVSQNGLCDANDISVGEVVNIGTLDADTNVGSEIHPNSLPTYDDDGYLGISGLYGIFNKFTGEVEYVANASSDVTSGNMTDVIAAKEAEGQAGGAYTDYVNFFNQIGGRCLTTQQEICLFPHAVSDDIPYII